MLKIYTSQDPQGWNACVRSFASWDIYYLFEYAYSFMLHGDGEPLLISYEDQQSRFCYSVMRQDISKSPLFSEILAPGTWYDLETPYGYGGPLSDGKIPADSQCRFLKELTDYCEENHIVSQFVRFHPLLANFSLLDQVIETRYMRDTIYMDTASPEQIMANLDSKNRNMVRKARKNNVQIQVRPITDYQEFLDMYIETMANNHADAYYTFGEDYFRSLSAMDQNACIFYAMLEDKPISAAIMYYNDRFMHYHLSGTHFAYRNVSPGNLLLYEAACWASEKGIRKFHLGGGMAPDDSLFGFKKQFNKNGRLPFYIGRTIFSREAYDSLLQLRKRQDPEFDENNGFMIQYRRP